MKSPRLDRQMVLETPTQVSDGAGGLTVVWATEGTVWAELTAGAGREAAGVEVRRAEVPWRITVRGAAFGTDARPRPEQRLRDGARVFTILAVSERDPAGRYLTCFAREEAPA